MSIEDVALRAGVHKSTVSRALLHPEIVNGLTRERVLSAARELGYRPNAVARMLATRTSPLVPLLVPDVSNPFFAELAKGVATAVEREGLYLTLCDTHGDGDLEGRYLRSLSAMQVELLIMVPGANTDLEALADSSHAPAQATVLVDRVPDDCPLSSVTIDNQLGVDLAIRHLRKLGHRRIAHVAGPPHTLTGEERAQHYRAAMEAAGDEPVLVAGGYTVEDGERAASEFVALEDRPTAVIAANDLTAIGFIGRLAELGTGVPDDVSVVGFDGLKLASHFRPKLTSLHQPVHEMAASAVSLGLARARDSRDGDNADPVHLRFEPTLEIRASTAPPKHR